jgi:catechol 2,3-dioxygenase-like lactoylglutathione lyase family enzyme
MQIARVDLEAPGAALAELARFYADTLGLPVTRADGAAQVAVGEDELRFAAAPGDARPFYHFALLVPGNRFAAAHAWLGERAELLPGDDGDTVFDFSFWDALACYFHDPAQNIVELIAHRGVEEGPDDGPFAADELRGISEIGIVTPRPADAVATLAQQLGLELWSGGVEETTGLGFVGRKAHTLIVAGAGRGWLPTGRTAEPFPVAVKVTGGDAREAQLPGTPARVRTG